MKGVKGKFLKKLKSIGPIGYLKQDRVLQVNASDGYVEICSENSCLTFEESEEMRQSSLKEQESEVIDVSELMKDLEDEDFDDDDKENIGSMMNLSKESVSCSDRRKTPLSEIDISSFRRPDLNSWTLFDPNLLQAFEQAVVEHIRISEVEQKARMEEHNREKVEEEPPLKSRRIEEEEQEDDDENENPLFHFVEKCVPGGKYSVVFYTTSLRGIRKTFEDCNSIRFLLESFRVLFHERDVSMHNEFKEQLWRILGEKSVPPRLFIKGRDIGGAEEVLGLHEQGKLRPLFNGVAIHRSNSPCQGCAGFRFLVCFDCNGSHRIVGEDGVSNECAECNENGLIVCSVCC